MRHLAILVLLGVLLLPTAWAGTADRVKVAAIFAKSSKMAYGNFEALNAVRFAVETLNRQGGLLGRPLELLEIDNRGTAIGSKIAAEKAVAANVVTVFGANWSSHSLAMAPVLQAAKIPMITPISTNPAVTRVGDYIFRVCYTDPFQGVVLARFAFDDLKARSAGLLVNVDDKYSEDLAEFFMEDFKAAGGRISFVENYLENASDFSALFEKIEAHQPDVVFHPGHTKMSAYVLKQARKNGIKTVFLGGDGWNDSMYKIGGSALDGSYYTNHWHPDSLSPKSREFVAAYEAAGMAYIPVSALSQDCVSLFADAVRRAGSFDPVRIRRALAATKNFEGVTGTISFNPTRDPVKSAVILQFEKGGSLFVKTVDPPPDN